MFSKVVISFCIFSNSVWEFQWLTLVGCRWMCADAKLWLWGSWRGGVGGKGCFFHYQASVSHVIIPYDYPNLGLEAKIKWPQQIPFVASLTKL